MDSTKYDGSFAPEPERPVRLPPPPQWLAGLDERTNKHIAFARDYAQRFAHGAPGHLDLMTIAKLAELLDVREPHESGPAAPERPTIQRVRWDETQRCWRDIVTGVRVDPLTPGGA